VLPVYVHSEDAVAGERWWKMAKKKSDKAAENTKKNGKKAEGTAEAIGEVNGKAASKKTGGKGSRNGRGTDEKKPRAEKALRKAVNAEMRIEADRIAKALVEKVVKGDKLSTDMMLSLIEKKKKSGEASKRHGGLTAADLLGSEDEWESESFEAVEGKSETGMGGREPEDSDQENGQ
jgi:hypothetical protein